MDRLPPRKFFHPLWLVVAASAVAAAGCTQLMVTAAILGSSMLTPAEFKDLKGKRVAVVCRTSTSLQYSGTLAAAEVSNMLSRLLRENIRKVEVINPERVAEWTDENLWNDFTEVGEALDADMVVGIDLEEFTLQESLTLYQGKAQVLVTVYDMRQNGRVVFERTMPRLVYPPNSGIAASDMPEFEFRRRFVTRLSDQIGRYFYDHDTAQDFAGDVIANK